jgi:hypothetical protein
MYIYICYKTIKLIILCIRQKHKEFTITQILTFHNVYNPITKYLFMYYEYGIELPTRNINSLQIFISALFTILPRIHSSDKYINKLISVIEMHPYRRVSHIDLVMKRNALCVEAYYSIQG